MTSLEILSLTMQAITMTAWIVVLALLLRRK